ncbi:serine/threonine-protein phosphatase 2A 56 kDa regulatory subunit delta isoform [Mucor velutinosus]|uniref:Serine/threonine-protein phosphatase 2A 56 kDa regulatory subunit delta isoform n=1 Tax=Mucor velutinosus TaxID=708070 RepID=A0AAN7DGW5_9FUNG|nr:serine/threonine-protein phosphatase 2A 56 kDa regulatory subunit delta isoform [Mucor velutinosus]
MTQDVFTQLYQSLTPVMGTTTPAQESSSMFDEWLKQDFLSECSVNSSPEIATPLDQFLMSPPFQSKDKISSKSSPLAESNVVDLDVSAILDSPAPQFFSMPSVSTPSTPAVAATPVPTAATSTACGTPHVQMTSLFADIGDSLPAALAALAAVAAPTPVATAAVPEMSPAVISASTPAFSASPSRSRKRSNDDASIDPADDAAVKRQKNTDAARRSRLRKVQKMETLEARVSELEKINAGLLMRVAVLDSEKTNLKAKESSYEDRIKVLEGQLAEAHKALSSRS